MRTKEEIFSLQVTPSISGGVILSEVEIEEAKLEVLIDIRDILADTFHEEHVRVKESD